MFLTAIAEVVFLFTRHSKFAQTRLSPISFYATTFFLGALIGSVFIGLGKEDTIAMKSLLMSAFVMTAAVFISVSVFALLTVRRTIIYFGSIISCLVLSVISIFLFRSPAEAVFGLIIGMLYVIIDTQLMIHKTENGLNEPYEDARQLFYDLVKILIEIMKILGKKEKKKD